jgi:hypothetical protein
VERSGAVDEGVVLVGDLHLGAHAAQLAEPLEAILEDGLVNVAEARPE